jgi:hypothetical protein
MYTAQITYWAMACTTPGEPMIGGFATWRNVPVTYSGTYNANNFVEAANFLTVTPNTDKFNNVQIGLFSERTGKTTQTYGPKWTELGTSGGKTHAINTGTDPNKADGTNHTYMLIRQDNTNQWDVLYDFNWVGTTTSQVAVPRGNANRLDVGLEVSHPEDVNVPSIANRPQYMGENKTWYRAKSADTAQVHGLGICGATMPGSSSKYAAPYCFKASLTGAPSLTQWTVEKPGPTTAPAAAPPTGIRHATRSAGVINGVDQAELASCMVGDAESCLRTVPGLAACIRQAKICNATAWKASASLKPSRHALATSDRDLEQIRARAAAAFGVSAETIHSAQATVADVDSTEAIRQALWPADQQVIVMTSDATTAGPGSSGTPVGGFQAVYAMDTGQLIDACWGSSCER